jgi:pimeloyl-ACP methyl ester carboxylesterase
VTDTYRTESFLHRGHRLVYDTYGEGDRLLVYVHGLLLDADLNRGIAAALADQGNRVVLLDLLGHGRSDRPAHASEYRIDSYADQVVALLDHLGAERATIGGLSLGANVSLVVAARHPERVRGMVLEMPVMEWAVPAAALTFVPMLLGARYAAPVLRMTAAVARRAPRSGFGPLDSVLGTASTPPEVISSILHGVLVGPVVPTLEERAAITVPTLVLAHTNDLIHPLNDARNLAAQLPASRLVRAHSPLELRLLPQRLTREISAFLSELWDGTELREDPAQPERSSTAGP